MSQRLVGLVVMVGVIGMAAWSVSPADEQKSADGESGPVYELRTYTTHPGRLPALNKRFRDHTMRIFKKHGIENVVYWVPVDQDNTLVYVLRHKSLDAAKRSWQSFGEDPEWVDVKAASEKDGPIVQKVVRQYLKTTDYSPMLR